ncbi:LOW QUALITY PROTEIN: sucrase-isomaltase, intestinal-like [Uloborus diversus]|uniref:LOW QUALITY PROTEIN: sucrase-isomaltase, intestinal-like n=1 Tax=Uloborus diversus TaxID=327109 RepID=UPI0024090891|nr:LOW QUALITY PROTEIN: sucrase-isomaltase, intestinal-like [Uloborus diversus]
MSKSSSSPAKICDQSPTNKTSKCCSGKKLVSYRCKVRLMATICILLMAAAGALLYFLLSKRGPGDAEIVVSLPKTRNWFPQCPGEPLKPEERFNCYPDDPSVSKAACEIRGCCFVGYFMEDNVTVEDSRIPTCVYPRNYGYAATGKAEAIFNGFEVPLRRMTAPSRYGDDIQVVYMRVEMQTKYRLRIKFYDPENIRYEVPSPAIPVHPSPQISEANAREVFLYSVTYNTVSSPFSVKVRRSSSDAVIFDTSVGALTIANQYLELTTKLASEKVYGLDQYFSKVFKHDFNWQELGLFSSSNLDGNFSSGVHPMYLCVENNGNAHGVLLLNSDPMEIQLHPSPAITFRTLGGLLDLYLFLGPSPEEVIQQYTEAVGHSFMPPYWSLGFHASKPRYKSVNEVEEFVNGFKEAHIPVEAFSVNMDVIKSYISGAYEFAGFSNFTSKLSGRNQKLLISFEPKISAEDVLQRDSIYNFGQQNSVLITDKWGLHPIVGMVGSKRVVYPDFGSTAAVTWWAKVLNKVASSIDIDGLWLVNNFPRNDVDGSINDCLDDNLNRPPYLPSIINNTLYHNTLCLDAMLHWKDDAITHYDYHNFYSLSSTIATEQAFSVIYATRRKLMLTDSTFVGSGQYAGHLVKGLKCDWKGLKSSVSIILKLNYHGIPFSGMNICGDEGESSEFNEELLLRWFQLCSFYPFMQMHGSVVCHFFSRGISDQDFLHAVRDAISRRYELLPYLYTLFYLSHIKGSTVLRPLFHEFPFENETYSITSQFMWGSSLLISPILEKGSTEVNFYLPEGVWYDFYQGLAIYSDGTWFTESGGPFHDSKQPAVLHIRGGQIITLQKPSETITASRQNSMSLLVALNSSFHASGFLYWDDGETKNSLISGEYITIDMHANKTSLIVDGKVGKKVFMSNFYRAVIQQVRIMGLHKPPKRIVIDGSYILSNKQYRWNLDYDVLDLKHILIPLGRRTEIQWFF